TAPPASWPPTGTSDGAGMSRPAAGSPSCSRSRTRTAAGGGGGGRPPPARGAARAGGGGSAPPPGRGAPPGGRGSAGGVGRVGVGGLRGLVEGVEWGGFREPAPIGFYFAKLWYFEKLYPVIFTVAALGRAVRRAQEKPRG